MTWRVPRPQPVGVAIGAGVGALGVAELVSGDAAVLSILAAASLGLPVMCRLARPAMAVAVAVVAIGGVTFANDQETPLAAAIALVITVGTAARRSRVPIRSWAACRLSTATEVSYGWSGERAGEDLPG